MVDGTSLLETVRNYCFLALRENPAKYLGDANALADVFAANPGDVVYWDEDGHRQFARSGNVPAGIAAENRLTIAFPSLVVLLADGRALVRELRIFIERLGYEFTVQQVEDLLIQLIQADDEAERKLRDWESVKERLVFRLKPTDAYTEFASMERDMRVVMYPWGNFYVWAAIDLPDTYSYVTAVDLERWGVTPEQVKAVTTANMLRRWGDVHPGKQGPAWVMACPDNITPALLFIPEVATRVAQQVNLSDVYVFVPHENAVLFLPRPSTLAGRERIVSYSRDAARLMAANMGHRAPRLLSELPYVWRDNQLWVLSQEELFDGRVSPSAARRLPFPLPRYPGHTPGGTIN